jgi:hypothetical protein
MARSPRFTIPRALETPDDRLERRLSKIKGELLETLLHIETFPWPIPFCALRLHMPAHDSLVDKLIAWLPGEGYTATRGFMPRPEEAHLEALIVEKKVGNAQ